MRACVFVNFKKVGHRLHTSRMTLKISEITHVKLTKKNKKLKNCRDIITSISYQYNTSLRNKIQG